MKKKGEETIRMEAAPGQQQELAVRNQHLPGSVAPSWAGDSGQDGLGTVPRMGHIDIGPCWGQGLVLGNAVSRQDKGQGLGMGTVALHCAGDSARAWAW